MLGYDKRKSYSLYQFGQTAVTCYTASKISAKVAGDVVTSRGYELTPGAVVSVQFTNAVIGDATLNIYGTGAKAIVYHDIRYKETRLVTVQQHILCT